MKTIRIKGKRYRVNPSMDNMCQIEEETGYNLVRGVSIGKQNLRFIRSVISNILETETGEHIPDEELNSLFKSDVSETQRVFETAMREMYASPKGDSSPKKVAARILRAMGIYGKW